MQYELYHHGILGMKWGIRRYQNKDGSLTEAGRKRYGSKEALEIDKSLGDYKQLKKTPRDPAKVNHTERVKKYGEVRDTVGKIVTNYKPEIWDCEKEIDAAYKELQTANTKASNEALEIAKERGIKDPLGENYPALRNIYYDLEENSEYLKEARKKFNDAVEKKRKTTESAVKELLGAVSNEKMSNFGKGSNSPYNTKQYAVEGLVESYIFNQQFKGKKIILY